MKDVNSSYFCVFDKALDALTPYIDKIQIGRGEGSYAKYKVILAIIRKRTGLDPDELRVELGLRGVTTQRVFDHLISNGILKQDKDGKYEILTWYERYFSPRTPDDIKVNLSEERILFFKNEYEDLYYEYYTNLQEWKFSKIKKGHPINKTDDWLMEHAKEKLAKRMEAAEENKKKNSKKKKLEDDRNLEDNKEVDKLNAPDFGGSSFTDDNLPF